MNKLNNKNGIFIQNLPTNIKYRKFILTNLIKEYLLKDLDLSKAKNKILHIDEYKGKKGKK